MPVAETDKENTVPESQSYEDRTSIFPWSNIRKRQQPTLILKEILTK